MASSSAFFNARPIISGNAQSNKSAKLDQKASSENEFSPREDAAEEELHAVRAALLAARVKQFQEDDEWISLKLDDTVFMTQRSTLLRCKDSLFNVMFQKNSPFLTAQDLSHPSKPYLIDRSPKYFKYILQYLRTGEIPEQADKACCARSTMVFLKGLRTEAKYFNLTDLVEELEDLLAQHEEDSKHKSELTRQDIIKALMNASSVCSMQARNNAQQHGISSSISNAIGNNMLLSSNNGNSGNGPSGNSSNSTIAMQQHARLRLQGVTLVGLDLSNLDLSYVNFCKSNLSYVNFTGANLEGADFTRATIENANFSGANMHRAILCRTKGAGVNLDSCNLQEADLSLSDFSSATLKFANLTNANLGGCMMFNADLTAANLKKCSLKGAILSGAEFNESCRATLPMGGVLH